MTEPSPDKRLTALEEEAAHLRVLNEELSSELVLHWKRIERLERELGRLENRFQAFEEQVGTPDANEKPPHW